MLNFQNNTKLNLSVPLSGGEILTENFYRIDFQLLCSSATRRSVWASCSARTAFSIALPKSIQFFPSALRMFAFVGSVGDSRQFSRRYKCSRDMLHFSAS